MKISASKKQLARIISENGGWRDVAEWAAQDAAVAFFSGGKPEYATQDKVWCANGDNGSYICAMGADDKIKCFHNTILSRDEYFHLHPAPDADGWIEWKGGECPVGKGVLVDVRHRDGGVYCSVKARSSYAATWGCNGWISDIVAYRLHKPEIAPVAEPAPEPVVEAKPTIEQFAADYRAKLAVAKQAQEEADSHRCGAEAALERLYLAGLEIGLDIAIADSEPEDKMQSDLVITDWRDLQVGDEIATTSGRKLTVTGIRQHDESWPIDADDEGGGEWCVSAHDWRFIRRPTKVADNA